MFQVSAFSLGINGADQALETCHVDLALKGGSDSLQVLEFCLLREEGVDVLTVGFAVECLCNALLVGFFAELLKQLLKLTLEGLETFFRQSSFDWSASEFFFQFLDLLTQIMHFLVQVVGAFVQSNAPHVALQLLDLLRELFEANFVLNLKLKFFKSSLHPLLQVFERNPLLQILCNFRHCLVYHVRVCLFLHVQSHFLFVCLSGYTLLTFSGRTFSMARMVSW